MRSQMFFLVISLAATLALAEQQGFGGGPGGRGGGPKMDDTTRAAFDTCHIELNIAKPSPGSEPSEADQANRKAIHDCAKKKLAAQGVTLQDPPQRGQGGRGGPPPEGFQGGGTQN